MRGKSETMSALFISPVAPTVSDPHGARISFKHAPTAISSDAASTEPRPARSAAPIFVKGVCSCSYQCFSCSEVAVGCGSP